MLQPAAIDGQVFARSAGVIQGRVGLESLPRLAQSGCFGLDLGYVLSGEINTRGNPGLRLAIDGSARMECQRCLGVVDVPIRAESQLELAENEAQILAAEDEIERVVAGREMSVLALVEEEVILALPMVPKHAQCRAATEADGANAPSAFQALAALKQSDK